MVRAGHTNTHTHTQTHKINTDTHKIYTHIHRQTEEDGKIVSMSCL